MLIRLMAFLVFCPLLLVLAVPASAASGQGQSASEGTVAPSIVDLTQEPDRPSDRQHNGDTQRYGMWIKGKNLKIEVRINDIPAFVRIIRGSQEVDVTFNEWIKRGVNVMDISIERFNERLPHDMAFKVYYQSPTQIMSDDRTTLFSNPEDFMLPYRQQLGIRSQTMPDLRLWQTEKIVLTDEEKQRILDSVNSLRARLIDAMVQGDNTFLATFEKPLRDQVDIAYGRIPQGPDHVLKKRKEIVEIFKEMRNEQAKATPLLTLRDVMFEPIADGHMVRLSRPDGGPIILVMRGKLAYQIEKPIYGSIGGVWERLR